MKLATWNVNSIRARNDRLLAWLQSRTPDVVCLQETKVTDDIFPADALRALGYQVAFHGQRTYNGVAILSRSALTDVTMGFGDGGDDTQARCIAATIDGVRVVGTYVPNGQDVGTDKYGYKLAWLERLHAYLANARATHDALVLCGDMNVAPEDRDVHDPEAWREKILCSTPERQGLAKAVAGWGTDLFRHHSPESTEFSWWDYRQMGFFKNRGLRIDLVYGSPSVLARSRGCTIDRAERKGDGASDHAPVIADFG